MERFRFMVETGGVRTILARLEPGGELLQIKCEPRHHFKSKSISAKAPRRGCGMRIWPLRGARDLRIATGQRVFWNGGMRSPESSWSAVLIWLTMAVLFGGFPNRASAGLATAPRQGTTKPSEAERNESLKRLVSAGIDAFQREAMADARSLFEAVIRLDPDSMVARRFLGKITEHELAHWAPVKPKDV